MINLKSKIYIAGHKGLVGSSILRKLKEKGYNNLLYKNKKELDLCNQSKVFKFLKKNKPDFIFIAAARVGGILDNNLFKADFIYQNLLIQSNLIHGAYLSGVKNLIFLGSSCVYPKNCKQPIKEEYLMTGELEATNDAYSVAKIAGIKMCESYNQQYGTNYRCLMPTNTFGPNDNYDSLRSHFLPALIKKIHHMKIKKKKYLTIWGNGKAKREIIHVDDIADACIYFMNLNTKEFLINIGTGKDYSINRYVKFISETIVGNKKYKIKYDKTKPNGTKRKVMDVSLAKKYGWYPKIELKTAIQSSYKSYLKEQVNFKQT